MNGALPRDLDGVLGRGPVLTPLGTVLVRGLPGPRNVSVLTADVLVTHLRPGRGAPLTGNGVCGVWSPPPCVPPGTCSPTRNK